MSKEHPILFSTPMVQAILEGRKTQTRRIVKPSPDENGIDYMPTAPALDWEQYYKQEWKPWHWETEEGESISKFCPYGEVGDLLWVKETYQQECEYIQIAGGDWANGYLNATGNYVYKADGISLQEIKDSVAFGKWKASIFMPKAAARIWLEITNIKVERLQDISEADAKAEGFYWPEGHSETYTCDNRTHWPTAKRGFNMLWYEINGAESWSTNPFVWVIEFKRVDQRFSPE